MSLHKTQLQSTFDLVYVQSLGTRKITGCVVENFGEDALRKLFSDLSNKEYWDEECSLCSMPTMLHKGSCSRKTEIGEAEHSDLWKLWSFTKRKWSP